MREHEIGHRFVHVDRSSFHLHSQCQVEGPEREAITITEGCSRGHRLALKQVVVQLITTSQRLSLPVRSEIWRGNSSDKESFPLSVNPPNQQMGESETPYYVMDSAGYVADNLKTLRGMRRLTRIPETLAGAKRLGRESKKTETVFLTEGYWGSREVKPNNREVEQRWLVVFSKAAFERELHALTKAQEKERLTAAKRPITPGFGDQTREYPRPDGETNLDTHHSLGVSDFRGG